MKLKYIFLLLVGFCSQFASAQVLDVSSRKLALHHLSTVEQTLGNPASDQHNEQNYVTALQELASCPLLTNEEKLRPQMLLEMAQKNAVGTPAANIEYVTLDGTTHQLLTDTTAYTLVYFNDPHCESCHLVKERLDTCTQLRTMVADDKLKIIAIYPYDDKKAWQQNTMPNYIINGWDEAQSIETEETYILPTLPLFYLITPNHHVALKNEPSLNRVLKTLNP